MNFEQKCSILLIIVALFTVPYASALTVSQSSQGKNSIIGVNDFQKLIRQDEDPPIIEWNEMYGSPGTDQAQDVQQTSDGGYIMTGRIGGVEDFDHCDLGLIKTDENGLQVWEKSFGLPGNKTDVGNSVQQTSDGGYIVAGFTNSYGADESDVWLLKTDDQGRELWNRTYGGNKTDIAWCIGLTKDNGFIIVGYTASYGAGNLDWWIIKTDSNGTELWNTTFGGLYQDIALSVNCTIDGGYVVTGYLNSGTHTGRDVFLIKINSTGDLQWQKSYNKSSYEMGDSVQQTSDGGFIIGGTTGASGSRNIFLIKTDENGTKLWDRQFNFLKDDYGKSLDQTSDGGFIMTGTNVNNYGGLIIDLIVIRTDAAGEEIWRKTVGSRNAREHGYAVEQTVDGGFIVAGDSTGTSAGDYDFWLIKIARDDILAPSVPEISGPADGVVGFDFHLNISSVDPEGFDIYYQVDWGDGISGTWNGPFSSGDEVVINHIYTMAGDFNITARAKNKWEMKSNFSESIEVSISNSLPSKPNCPEGPERGDVGEEYVFTSTTSDPDGHDIRYGWDWNGDSVVDEWTSYYSSGETIFVSHTYLKRGDYEIRVIAQDRYQGLSPWSDPLEVYMAAPTLDIQNIRGGIFSIRADILNAGDGNASEIEWTIEIEGDLIFLGERTNGSLVLSPFEERTVRSKLVFGFDEVLIRISADIPYLDTRVTETQVGRIIGFFIII